MAKRKKIMGLPIGKKSGPGLGAWVSGAAAVVGGAMAARKAVQELKESSPVQKGKQAAGNLADAGKKVSSVAEKVGGSGPLGKVTSALGVGGGSNGSGDKGRSGADQGHVQKLAWIIDEHIDVGVPRREAYNQWTQFDQFSEIFKGVESVDQKEEDEQHWSAKVGPSRRQFDVEITDQVPDKRIAWKASGGANVQGVVTFHELDDELTHINVEIVYRPQGFVEHVGNWFRAARRRVRKDLKLFKNYIEFRGEATGEWRGRISKEGGRGDAAVDGSPAPEAAAGESDDRSSSKRTSSSKSSSGNGSARTSSKRPSSKSSSKSSSSGATKRSSSSSRKSGSSSGASRSTRTASRSKRSSSPKSSSSGGSRKSSRSSSSGSRAAA